MRLKLNMSVCFCLFQSQLQMASEKKHHNDRIAKLEEQMKHMNFTTTSGLATMANIGNNSLRLV